MTVAIAAPPTPNFRTRIKIGSRMIFVTVDSRLLNMDCLTAPSALKMFPPADAKIIIGAPIAKTVRYTDA